MSHPTTVFIKPYEIDLCKLFLQKSSKSFQDYQIKDYNVE
ncbi:hypothetical protein HMPREF0518_0582 [Lactobacillus helveticus DSM 20075 = CGMCC 1.1877]|nr:hypothetical protein HMPREF0518_0582 [Lactobacillus helveticus DSM 20075 = CGMCC 1.1877]